MFFYKYYCRKSSFYYNIHLDLDFDLALDLDLDLDLELYLDLEGTFIGETLKSFVIE